MDDVEKILDELGKIRDRTGQGLKIMTKPDSHAYRTLGAIGLKKQGVFDAADPRVVEEARKLAAGRGVWIVLAGREYELFS